MSVLATILLELSIDFAGRECFSMNLHQIHRLTKQHKQIPRDIRIWSPKPKSNQPDGMVDCNPSPTSGRFSAFLILYLFLGDVCLGQRKKKKKVMLCGVCYRYPLPWRGF